MPSQEEIDAQQELLATYRRNLSNYLRQQAMIGDAYVPPATLNGIQDARDNIARIKRILHNWGVTVEDHADDVESSTTTSTSSSTGPLGERRFAHKQINDVIDHLRMKHNELQTNSLPMSVLIPELDILFDSKTFRFEPLYECTDQAWDRRLHYAFQVLDILEAYQRNVRDRGSREQHRLYRQLIDEASGYTMHMGSYLFESIIVHTDIDEYIGTNEFYRRLPQKRIFPSGGTVIELPENVVHLCEGKRKSSIKFMDKLSETVR